MYIATRLYIIFFGKYVGQDEYGNKYYISKFSSKNKQRRLVLYSGVIEASKIPPLWHKWLHYSLAEIPLSKNIEKYNWQKEHLPNLSLTSKAYNPDVFKTKKSIYEKWQPHDVK